MCSFQEKYATKRYVTLRYTFIFDCNMRPSDSECDTGKPPLQEYLLMQKQKI